MSLPSRPRSVAPTIRTLVPISVDSTLLAERDLAKKLLLADPSAEADLLVVPGDGDCLIHSLMLVFGDTRNQDQIRESTCAYVYNNWEQLNWPHITNETAAKAWYERFRRSGVYLGEDFATAYCIARNCNLVIFLVHRPSRGANKGLPTLKPFTIIANPDSRYHGRIIYLNNNHYDAVIHINTSVFLPYGEYEDEDEQLMPSSRSSSSVGSTSPSNRKRRHDAKTLSVADANSQGLIVDDGAEFELVSGFPLVYILCAGPAKRRRSDGIAEPRGTKGKERASDDVD